MPQEHTRIDHQRDCDGCLRKTIFRTVHFLLSTTDSDESEKETHTLIIPAHITLSDTHTGYTAALTPSRPCPHTPAHQQQAHGYHSCLHSLYSVCHHTATESHTQVFFHKLHNPSEQLWKTRHHTAYLLRHKRKNLLLRICLWTIHSTALAKHSMIFRNSS